MVGDRAAKSGPKIHILEKLMDSLTCDICLLRFIIFQRPPDSDSAWAKRQAQSIKDTLAKEHADPDFTGHLGSYDLEDVL